MELVTIVISTGLSLYCDAGHVRLGEVYQATYNLELAIPSYQSAFQCRDSDKVYCKLMLDKCKKDLVLDVRADM